MESKQYVGKIRKTSGKLLKMKVVRQVTFKLTVPNYFVASFNIFHVELSQFNKFYIKHSLGYRAAA